MHDITFSRVIKAPRERVFQAHLTPDDLVRWHHAGDGWTTPFAETDAHVGGAYRIGYQSADASQGFVLEGTYQEIAAPERIVYSIGPDRRVIVTFAEAGGADATLVSVAFTTDGEYPDELQRNGWSQHYDNLAAYLERA